MPSPQQSRHDLCRFEQRGELSAAVEPRRLFPAITDTAQARACARTIAGWNSLPVPLRLEIVQHVPIKIGPGLATPYTGN